MCAVACQQAVLHATRWAEDGPEQPTTLPFTASLGSSQRSSSSNLSSDDKKSTSVQASGGPSFGFYLFGDIPYAEWEEGMLRDQIAHLSKTRLNHTLFTVHVGDLQKTQRSLCKEDYYRMVQKVLRKGPLPTYVLAGDNDWYGEFEYTEATRIANFSAVYIVRSLTRSLTHSLMQHTAQFRLSQTQGSLEILW